MMEPGDDTLIFQASELPEEERTAFLDRAAGGDAARVECLKARLDELREAEAFFEEAEPPSEARARFSTGGERAGGMIGAFRLLEQIGEGGFGTVWRAEQERPVRRRVALKIIKAGMDTKEVVARFEQERQALALMNHPNIAQVYDAGATEAGRPYFIMELVEGVPVTQFCDGHCLTVGERLRLFGEICEAVHHAHQKGIIHRDLKPANILVTGAGGRPAPKVIDFGIARAVQQSLTDNTLFTRLEQLVGTPAYMSPEQARGARDIDTRSDIYALGVLLYELLTGAPPFDQKSLLSAGHQEIRRVICVEEPPKPSTRLSAVRGERRAELAGFRRAELSRLEHLLKGDLDWIVMRAIEKDRARRYGSVGALAEDIRRHLADEPVSATPPGAVYVMGKFARRHRAAVIAGAAVALALMLGLTLSTWMFFREREARELAARRLAESEAAERKAATISTFLLEIFKSPYPERDGPQVTVAHVLDRAAAQLPVSFNGPSEERAVLQEALAMSYDAIGSPEHGVSLMEEASTHVRLTYGAEHERACRMRGALAMLYSGAWRHNEAVTLMKSVLEWERRTNPGSPAVVQRMIDLAKCQISAGSHVDAHLLLKDALPLCREDREIPRSELIRALNLFAKTCLLAGKHGEAAAAGGEALRLTMKGDADTCVLLQTIALSHRAAGHLQEAVETAENYVELCQSIYGEPHTFTARAAGLLGELYEQGGRTDDAIRVWQASVLIANGFPEIKYRLGAALFGRRRYQEAMAAFSRAHLEYPTGDLKDELERMLTATREKLAEPGSGGGDPGAGSSPRQP